jgi:hypothetical protein
MPTLAIYVTLVLLIYAAGATSGFKVESWRWSAAELAATQAVESDRVAKETKEAAAATQVAQTEEKERVVYRTIVQTVDRIVEKPVYRDRVCLDADGLRAANSALLGTAAPGQPDPALPAVKPARGRPSGHGPAQAGGSGTSVP